VHDRWLFCVLLAIVCLVLASACFVLQVAWEATQQQQTEGDMPAAAEGGHLPTASPYPAVNSSWIPGGASPCTVDDGTSAQVGYCNKLGPSRFLEPGCAQGLKSCCSLHKHGACHFLLPELSNSVLQSLSVTRFCAVYSCSILVCACALLFMTAAKSGFQCTTALPIAAAGTAHPAACGMLHANDQRPILLHGMKQLARTVAAGLEGQLLQAGRN
jgi:hypothetical protein